MSCPTWCAWPIAWRSTRSSSSILPRFPGIGLLCVPANAQFRDVRDLDVRGSRAGPDRHSTSARRGPRPWRGSSSSPHSPTSSPSRNSRPRAVRLALAGAYVSYQGLAMPCCMVATPDRIQLGSMAERGPWPSGTARTTRPSAISSRRITRRKSAGRARSTRGRFEPPGEARDRGGLR